MSDKVNGTVAAPKVKKPREKRDPSEARKKLEERIAKLTALLNKKQTELAVTADPRIAGVEKRLKAAKASLAAANRFEAMARKKLARLRTEVVDTEKRIEDYQAERVEAQARIAKIEPELEDMRAGVAAGAETPDEE